MKRLTPAPAILILLAAFPCFAGGILIYEHGAVATGMADARTASADDLSALYFNPAAITELEGLQLQLGVTGILPYTSYEAAGNPDPPRTYTRTYTGEVITVDDGTHSTDAKIRGYTPFHLYTSYQMGDSGLSFGFGLNNPFGLGSHWPEDWDGRFITIEAEMTTYVGQPVIAVDIARLAGFKDRLKLSAAVGYDLVYGTALLGRAIDLRAAEANSLVPGPQLIDPEGRMRLTGSALGHGFTAAVYAELPGLLSFGAAVRSGVRLDFSGTAKFWFNPEGQRALELTNSHIPAETTGRVTFNLPWNMNFGLAYLGFARWKLALDFFLALFQSHKELDIRFDCLDDRPACNLKQDPIKANWIESWQLSLGAEYELTDHLLLRAGYGTVSNPVPVNTYEASLPDGHRHLLCAGGSYRESSWKVDVGYMLAMWDGVKNNEVGTWDARRNPNGKANGRYVTRSHLLALSVSTMF